MKKTYIKVAILLAFTLGAIIAIRFFFGGAEDNRICNAGSRRIKHGNSSAPMPSSGCILPPKEATMPSTLQIIADRVNNGHIPARYTCDAGGEFPPLTIHNIPTDAKSLALIIDDPDAPNGTRDHYLLADISVTGENFKITQATEKDAVVGKNSRGKTSRGAPCPPNGTHRYFFKIFALSAPLDIKSGFSKDELLATMKGKIVSSSELIGLYQKK